MLEAIVPGVSVCPRCEGIWVTSDTLDIAFGDPRWPPSHGMWWHNELACPECAFDGTTTIMDARSANDVNLDRCPIHGLWLDRGELGRVMKTGSDELAELLRRIEANIDMAQLAERRQKWQSELRRREQDAGDAISLEVRDLDGDGIEEAVLVVDWRRTTKATGGCKGCWVSTDEEAKQLYVLAGAGTAVARAFTHVVSYETHSEGFPEDNATPYASPEQVAYDWKLVDGKPPVVKLTRTKHEVAKEDRLKGVLDPSIDPLFAAGPGKDVPLVLE